MVFKFIRQKLEQKDNKKHVFHMKGILKYMLLLWVILIFIFSLYPSSELPENPGIPHLDKLVHFVMYFVFSLFFLVLYVDIQRLGAVLKLLLVVLLLTLITEILQQTFPINRTASLYDGLANFTGFFSAIGIYRTFLKSGWT